MTPCENGAFMFTVMVNAGWPPEYLEGLPAYRFRFLYQAQIYYYKKKWADTKGE